MTARTEAEAARAGVDILYDAWQAAKRACDTAYWEYHDAEWRAINLEALARKEKEAEG